MKCRVEIKSALLLPLLLFVFSACPQQMASQPRLDPLEEFDFFPGRTSAQTPVKGTIARGLLREDAAFFTGKTESGEYAAMPAPASQQLIQRGAERFQIYCQVCHGTNARGDGPVVKRGFLKPPDFLGERVLNLADGQIFEAITVGYGAMPPYGPLVDVPDRWAIIAYIRHLQANAPPPDAPPKQESESER